MTNITDDELRRLHDQAVRAADQRSWVAGVLGRINGDGSITVDVPDRPTHVYVRIGQDQTVAIARDANQVPRRANLPVKMRREGNQLVIYGVDTASGRYEVATAGDATDPVFGVTAHNHRLNSGMTYEVEALRFEPGRVRWYGGLKVYINAFRYYHAGAWQTWPGGDIDLAAVQPVTSGKWAWALVGVDPATNQAVAVAGAEEDTTTPLTLAMLDSIDAGGMIPAAAVRLRWDDTTLGDIGRYVDAHGWFTPPLDLSSQLQANTMARLATVTEIDATAIGATELYVVPAGKSLVVDRVVVRCTDFDVGSKATEAIASFGGNDPDYDDYLTSLTWTIAAADVAIVDGVLGVAAPVYGPGASFRLSIETASDADAEEWAVDLFGYLI